ncbi:MAG: AAA family ATPase [Actinomycetaceae bacterium]|nr:AAA family ATPase [Actinomycetaceae bacterium]MDU0970715.1 AAA family ATPase [Actinomycetaceae bacterium]
MPDRPRPDAGEGADRTGLARACLSALTWAQAAGRRGVIAIDGRSGSGKSTLAARLAADLTPRVPGLTCLAVEDWYPGWDGLAEGARILVDSVLTGESAYQRWDWHAGTFGPHVEVDPHAPLLIEGCGALTVRSRPLIDFAIWVDAPRDVRKSRALARDGETYAPFWDAWAAQEDALIADNHPENLADVVVTVPTAR